MKIVKLEAAFKNYIWGGTKLRDIYEKNCNFNKVAESWELSTHKDGQSVIAQGEFKGITLNEYIEIQGRKILGNNALKFENFPVLIKFIDAKNPLSVQVHPSDEYALKVEKEYGKTEMWYVMECDKGSSLYFGVNKEISKEDFAKKINDNTVEEVLNKVEVNKGDVFFIEAGTIHAIGAGIMICEIQQNSNTTYRVYDYGRVGDDGNPRELHVQKALDVSNFSPTIIESNNKSTEEIQGGQKIELASCQYFTAEKYNVDSEMNLFADLNSFVSIVILEGSGEIIGDENSVKFVAGDSIFVPADLGVFTVKGECQLIKTTV
ncbi:MAG: type I phosphomannose isomerase catalytic subunit [Clostridia bacterium]